MQNKHKTCFSFFGGPTYGEGVGGPLVGPNAQLFPKNNFDGSPNEYEHQVPRKSLYKDWPAWRWLQRLNGATGVFQGGDTGALEVTGSYAMVFHTVNHRSLTRGMWVLMMMPMIFGRGCMKKVKMKVWRNNEPELTPPSDWSTSEQVHLTRDLFQRPPCNRSAEF